VTARDDILRPTDRGLSLGATDASVGRGGLVVVWAIGCAALSAL
jgi:hypothetical protein